MAVVVPVGCFYSLGNTTDMGITALTILPLVTVSVSDFLKQIILSKACAVTEGDSNGSKVGIHLILRKYLFFEYNFCSP